MTALYTFILNVSITFLKFRLNVLLRYGIVQEKGGDYVTVGENIQKIRKDMGLTQKELAEKVGVATITIQQYERNVRVPKIETLSKIGAALGVLWYELYPDVVDDTTVKSSDDYETRLAAACKWLDDGQKVTEIDSGGGWSTEEQNRWLTDHFEEAAKKFDVEISDLEEQCPKYVDDDEFSDLWMPENISLSAIVDKKDVAKIFAALEKLNSEGQRVAVERVRELTEIARYQRHESENGEK